jgi:hypothetical protein
VTPEESLAYVQTAWPAAFKTHHGSARTVERQKPGSAEPETVTVHATDPPANFVARRRGVRRPGPMPVHLARAEKGHPVETNRHTFRAAEHTDAKAWDMALAAHASHVLVDARRRHAGGVALGAVTLETVGGEALVAVETTLVLKHVEAPK